MLAGTDVVYRYANLEAVLESGKPVRCALGRRWSSG
jgi:hypothetical protein